MLALRRALAPFAPLALALLPLAVSATAHANGRFPAAQHVLAGPGTASSTIVLRTTFGFAASDDGGATFHWMCEEFLGYAGPAYDPPFVIDQRGRIELGLFDGLLQVSTDRCTATRVSVADGEFMVDLDQSADGATVVGVTSNGSPGSINKVYRSDDGGDTFRKLGDGITGVLFETLEMARTDTNRVYLTAVQTSPRAFLFYRSDDGGVTLTQTPFPMGTTVQGAFVAAVDPTDRDTVYVRSPLPAPTDGGAYTGSTALYRTRDAGQTWETVMQTVGPMLGFAISDDGQTLWVGGSDSRDGLMRSTDRGASFQKISDMQVLCLRQHAGALYVCSNYVLSGFGLGRSMDNGDTIAPLLRFQDLEGPFTCPSTSTENSICGERWPRVYSQFVPPDAGSSSDAGSASDAESAGDARVSADGSAVDAGAGMDGGHASDAGGGSVQGGCTARPHGGRGGLIALALAALAGAVGARRRRAV